MNIKKEQLQKELSLVFKKAEKHRKIIQISRVLCYGGALVYFLGFISLQLFMFSGGDASSLHSLDPDASFLEKNKTLVAIIPLFILITIGGYGLSYFQQKFSAIEQSSIQKVIHQLFPEAKLSLTPATFPMSDILKSNFFGSVHRDYSSGLSFGKIIFDNEKPKVVFQDVLISGSKSEHWLSNTSLGALILVLKSTIKGVTSSRVENITGSFRGMFASAKLEKDIKGSVVILPDHLEKHLDYLAKNIQALKSVGNNKLVQLEDVEFERYFAVYASDEVTARYVLTPAMMKRITELKNKYNRDIMLSFNGNQFYFAVSMPEGFLTLGDSSLTTGEAIADLYDNFSTVRGTLNDLNL